MSDEQESVPSSLSLKDLVSMRISQSDELDGSHEKLVGYWQELSDEIESIPENVSGTGEREVAEIRSAFSGLIESGLVAPNELPSLVRSFEYHKKAPKSAGSPEDRAAAVASWKNFKIFFHKRLFAKQGESGEFAFNVSHHIGHEIGHSIIELINAEQITTDISKIESLVSSIETNHDSSYIRKLADRDDVDQNLILTERIADLFGLYLTSGGDQNKFRALRLANVAPELAKEAEEGKLDDETTQLFQALDQVWKGHQDQDGVNHRGIKAQLKNADPKEATKILKKKRGDKDLEYDNFYPSNQPEAAEETGGSGQTDPQKAEKEPDLEPMPGEKTPQDQGFIEFIQSGFEAVGGEVDFISKIVGKAMI